MNEQNLTMLTDFYEITMANGYFENHLQNKIACFDMFFRKVPDDGGYAIMAGVQQLIQYLQNLSFTSEDIDYLRSFGYFNEKFLDYLANFQFTCDVWAMEEGSIIFPYEPIVSVRGPIMEAQFIETMVLLTVNHQSLIATKANRIVRAAQGRPVMEFGSRRAQGYYGATHGARASFIGGCASTACTIASKEFGIPVAGTMAHSWVQLFDNEYEAFKAYVQTYPDNVVLLVDTYNVLKSGIPNAIRVFNEVLTPMGRRPIGIRIDSGDITYLSKAARKILDEAGYPDCKIVATNALDEYIIRDLLLQGAKVDSFGVGERLITSRSEPVFGGVYKLTALYHDGKYNYKIKISENAAKVTTPGFKQVWRFYDKDTGKAIGDVVTLFEEEIDENQPYVMFDPVHTWKKKRITNFRAKKMLTQLYKAGKLVYESPDIHQIQQRCTQEVDTLWDEVLRFENPHIYYVDLSPSLWEIKENLLNSLT